MQEKYDRLAPGFAEASYANLSYFMECRYELATQWGPPMLPGESILELGCGDGYLARLFVMRGYQYSGSDISREMIEASRERLRKEDLRGDFFVCDVNDLKLETSYDIIVGYMANFFAFARDPFKVISQLSSHARKKIILDLNPRVTDPAQAVRIMKDAGLSNIAWRPFMVPKMRRLPVFLLKALTKCETIPVLRKLPIMWKFNVCIMGEI